MKRVKFSDCSESEDDFVNGFAADTENLNSPFDRRVESAAKGDSSSSTSVSTSPSIFATKSLWELGLGEGEISEDDDESDKNESLKQDPIVQATPPGRESLVKRKKNKNKNKAKEKNNDKNLVAVSDVLSNGLSLADINDESNSEIHSKRKELLSSILLGFIFLIALVFSYNDFGLIKSYRGFHGINSLLENRGYDGLSQNNSSKLSRNIVNRHIQLDISNENGSSQWASQSYDHRCSLLSVDILSPQDDVIIGSDQSNLKIKVTGRALSPREYGAPSAAAITRKAVVLVRLDEHELVFHVGNTHDVPIMNELDISFDLMEHGTPSVGLHLLEVSFMLLDVPILSRMTDSDRSCYSQGRANSGSVSATASVAFYYVDEGAKCGENVDVIQAQLVSVNVDSSGAATSGFSW